MGEDCSCALINGDFVKEREVCTYNEGHVSELPEGDNTRYRSTTDVRYNPHFKRTNNPGNVSAHENQLGVNETTKRRHGAGILPE